jgi:glycerophosphoryl diester phosphodiesterase
MNFEGDRQLIGRPFSSLSRRELAHVRYPDGSKILKLRTALREARELGITLMLDVKGNSARDFKRVMDDVYESEGESQVVVQCQAIEILAYMRERYPKVAVLARAHRESDVEALLGYAPELVQIDHDWNVPGLVERIHEEGARAVVKTLTVDTDTQKEWRRLCEAGVDIILTDRPRDLLAARMVWGDKP